MTDRCWQIDDPPTPSVGRMRRALRWLGALVAAVLVVLAGWVAWVNLVSIPATETLSVTDGPGTLVDVADTRVHVRTWGPDDGEPIVLVPGFGPPGLVLFEDLAAELAAAGRRVVGVDLVGFGWSERPTEAGPHLTVRGRADLLKRVAYELGLGAVDVVGHSYGGGVVAQWALDAPGRVDELVLVAAQVYGEGGGVGGVLGGLPLGIGRAVSFTVVGAGPAASALYGLECDVGGACPTDEQLETWSRPARVAGTSTGLVAISRTEPDADPPGALPAAPTLVVWGANDTIIPLEQGERLAGELGNGRLAVVEGAAHTPFLTHSADVADLVLEHTSD